MAGRQTDSTICFYRVFPAAPEPRRADRAAGGLIPTRALRFCDPLTSATAFGWWVFPPMGFSLLWDGSVGVFWAPEGSDSWYPLRAAQYPDFAEHFASIAPEDVGPYAPPFLTTLIEPGNLQIFTGWIARTRPGWSSLIRQPANFPRHQGLECYEGIVETDTWFGPLFINVRLTKTDVPILIRDDQPLLLLTPIFREHYSDKLLDDVQIVGSLGDWTGAEWDGFRRTLVAPHKMDHRPPGLYATAARRRRKRAE
jgi:hypothetical protein